MYYSGRVLKQPISTLPLDIVLFGSTTIAIKGS
jgi:hypothetical protein